jgi:hypothetical protein
MFHDWHHFLTLLCQGKKRQNVPVAVSRLFWKGEKLSIRVEVIQGDALDFPAEVLALKFAQHLFGVDRKVVDRLERKGIRLKSQLPAIGTVLLVNSEHAIAAREVLFIGSRLWVGLTIKRYENSPILHLRY